MIENDWEVIGMLAEERFREIQKYVDTHGTVTVQELTEIPRYQRLQSSHENNE